MTLMSIQRSKMLIKRLKKSIKRLKMSLYIKRVDLYEKSRTLWMYFQSLSIEIKHFDGFLSHWNQFCRDDWDSDNAFGSKKLI